MISSTEDEYSSSDSDSDYDLSDPEAGCTCHQLVTLLVQIVLVQTAMILVLVLRSSLICLTYRYPILPSTHVLPHSSTPGDSVTPRG